MKNVIRLVTLVVLMSGTFFVSSTFACSIDAWESVAAGATVGDPSISIARVGGKCALQVSGTGHVVDNSPADETTFIGRFYFYPKLLSAGTYEIFVAYSDQTDDTSDVFVITYDGTNFILTASDGGDFASAPADPDHWNQIEFTWTSGGTGSLWVNADAALDPASDTFASGAGSIDQIRMGAVDGVGADLAFFDDYESHRTTAVGPLLAGDGNLDGAVNSGDINVVVNEFLANNLGNGVVDCNLDGAVNSGDVNCIVAIFLNP
jgi:hypothetical protein